MRSRRSSSEAIAAVSLRSANAISTGSILLSAPGPRTDRNQALLSSGSSSWTVSFVRATPATGLPHEVHGRQRDPAEPADARADAVSRAGADGDQPTEGVGQLDFQGGGSGARRQRHGLVRTPAVGWRPDRFKTVGQFVVLDGRRPA